MTEIKYYTLSYGMLFFMAGFVLLVTTFSILVETIRNLQNSKSKQPQCRLLKNYDEITDIIAYQEAPKKELVLALKSFVKYFTDLPPRNEIAGGDKLKMLNSKMDFVYEFVKHPNTDESVVETLRKELYGKHPDYQPDFEKQIEKALETKKN